MNAGVADNVATIAFDVAVYPDVLDGTVISNQAFVSSLGWAVYSTSRRTIRGPRLWTIQRAILLAICR